MAYIFVISRRTLHFSGPCAYSAVVHAPGPPQRLRALLFAHHSQGKRLMRFGQCVSEDFPASHGKARANGGLLREIQHGRVHRVFLAPQVQAWGRVSSVSAKSFSHSIF